jgi:cell division septation protein DedD
MLSRLMAVALLASIASPTVSNARSIREVGPPKNPPPASFAGKQFVDSRGCVYMRAGYNGKVTWVPRLDDSKQVLCGYQPTVVPGAVAVASAKRPAAPAPAPAAQTAPAAGTAMAAAAPVAVMPPVPKGYVRAWKDGRLNPERGPRTAAGDAAMYRIWTHSVPMRLRPKPQAPVMLAAAAPANASAPRLSTSNARQAPAAVQGRFVQVGSYARPANAQLAVARLLATGLPVATAAGHIGQRRVRLVLAGPFDDPQATGAALAVARAAGFRDAFARD